MAEILRQHLWLGGDESISLVLLHQASRSRLPGALAATSFGTGVYTLALGIVLHPRPAHSVHVLEPECLQ